MLTGIHFLLTYACNWECDHCFLYCGPTSEGTFTIKQVREVLDEAARLGTVKTIYFEGGEAFLYYPLMVEGLRLAREKGFQTGIVTNSYWATSEEDAELWLLPLVELGISDLSISDDEYHWDKDGVSPAQHALAAAKRLGLPVDSLCIEKPRVDSAGGKREKGAPVVKGGAMLKGRAVEKLVEDLPQRPWREFTECPFEDLERPGRVHVDPFGHVHLCQGLSMGNRGETPLSELVRNYDAGKHPVCAALVRGGPAELARQYELEHENSYVDACHFCYLLRRALIDRFPGYLVPRQVYGLE
ncbi:MAG: hypothetical protein A2Y63_02575 [Candidatus Riflebacteria bacterium RBG_13_59_9]|nr:MAG: hypothetical protein A2Y63_02575 [Candidatus Riflebacteria bacterium RBG_13_59_9]